MYYLKYLSRWSISIALLIFAVFLGFLLTACTDGVSRTYRGQITTADGITVAQSVQEGNGFKRVYPQDAFAAQLIGSIFGKDASNGIENQYKESLESSSDIELTIDSATQQAAEDALAGKTGTAVVVDSQTGAVAAMASTPTCNLNEPVQSGDTEATLLNKAVKLYIPGSVFKTVTLAAALEQGVATIDSVYDAPASIVLEQGAVSNYGSVQYGFLPVHLAYALSCNTVFAQLALEVGLENLDTMAQSFGFNQQISQDITCEVSSFENKELITDLGEAWCGPGQALRVTDEKVSGPTVTALQMASITSVFANGGTAYAPYVIQSTTPKDGSPSVTTPRVINKDFISEEHRRQISDGMLEAVMLGTAGDAAVSGVEVRGKTGTAETMSGFDNGWFCGYATMDAKIYTVVVMLEDATSPEACQTAASIIEAILPVEKG